MSDEKKMSDEELRKTLSDIITDAIDLDESELAPARAQATAYYKGEPFGNEEDGRSQFVLTEVRDGVSGVVPSLLRVIFGAEQPVQFEARSAGGTEQAQQATDYIQRVFVEENGGFLKTHSVIKDGCVRKLGIFKWWWDDTESVKPVKLENVPASVLEQIAGEEGVELNRVVETRPAKITPPLLDPSGNPAGQPQVEEALYSVELTYTTSDGRLRVDSLPPEEFIFSREARDVETALMVGHRTRKTTSQLLELGVKQKDIDAHGGDDESLRDSEDEEARKEVETGPDAEAGEANDKHLYIEAYVKIDFDGDERAELRKVCTLGPSHYPVSNEPVDERPFAVFCPDPEPHTMAGQSWADRLMDLQLVQSRLIRATLDSLALSIFPRVGYVEGEVNVTDILNTEIGAPIRMRKPGMMETIKHDFTGREALPLFDFFANVTERRTGRNRGTMGLDADALQSTTKDGVGAAITSAQEQTELLARIFAEGTLKPLFRGMLRLMVAKKPEAKMVRLRGKWVEVDPRSWDADMDVIVNVAIGAGQIDQKIATLTELAATQKEILGTLGANNPVCTVAQFANTVKQILRLRGIRDTTPYINDVDPNWQPPQQEPQPSPEQVLAQAQLEVEKMKAEKALMIKQAELELKKEQMMLEHSQKVEQSIAENELKRYEIDRRYAADVSAAQLKRDQISVDAAIKEQESTRTHERETERMEHEQAVTEHERMLEQERHDQEIQHADEQHAADLEATRQAAQEPTE